jgi:2'-5' RNA ligase
VQLQAVIVPPQSVLQDALAAAQTIHLKPQDAPPEKPGMVARLLHRQSEAAAPSAELTVVASNTMFVRVARLGSVTSDDARRLARALGEVAATWPAPVVHVAELGIELTDTQLLVNAQLGGDTDGLKHVFRNFNEAAKAQRFFLDRRSFRPEFTVASIDLPDDPSFLERLEWDAENHRGPDWQATSIAMMRVAFGDKEQTFEEFDSLALAGDSGRRRASQDRPPGDVG